MAAASKRLEVEAEEAVLNKAIEKAETEMSRLIGHRDSLKKNIEKLKKDVARLEARGPRVIALEEYKRLRLEAVQSYKALSNCEVAIRGQTKNLKELCRDLKSTQEQLRSLRRLYST